MTWFPPETYQEENILPKYHNHVIREHLTKLQTEFDPGRTQKERKKGLQNGNET
jgi:hypothetical protein